MRVKKESQKTGLTRIIWKPNMTSGPITLWQIDGEKVETVTDFVFMGPKITVDSDCSHNYKTLPPWKQSYGKSWQYIEKQKHPFADKGPYSQRYGFSRSRVQMWELNHKEGRVPKSWCFPIMVLEKTLQSPLDTKEIKPVNPKGNQPRISIVRTDTEASILWPPDVKS